MKRRARKESNKADLNECRRSDFDPCKCPVDLFLYEASFN